MKGYLYTIEVLIAVSLVMASYVLIFQSPPTKPSLEVPLVKQQGFLALEHLDSAGILRPLVFSSAESRIEQELDRILVDSIKFETDVCGYSCNSTNVPANVTVVAVDYYVSGYTSSFFSKKVRLWMWTE